jgi:hypothetical protein
MFVAVELVSILRARAKHSIFSSRNRAACNHLTTQFFPSIFVVPVMIPNDFQTFPGWWFQTFFIFPYIGNVIIPTDFHIFQDG